MRCGRAAEEVRSHRSTLGGGRAPLSIHARASRPGLPCEVLRPDVPTADPCGGELYAQAEALDLRRHRRGGRRRLRRRSHGVTGRIRGTLDRSVRGPVGGRIRRSVRVRGRRQQPVLRDQQERGPALLPGSPEGLHGQDHRARRPGQDGGRQARPEPGREPGQRRHLGRAPRASRSRCPTRRSGRPSPRQRPRMPGVALDGHRRQHQGRRAATRSRSSASTARTWARRSARQPRKLLTDSGWLKDTTKKVGVLSVEVQTLSVCNDRTDNEKAADQGRRRAGAQIFPVPYTGETLVGAGCRRPRHHRPP